jgi:hypothetical protein
VHRQSRARSAATADPLAAGIDALLRRARLQLLNAHAIGDRTRTQARGTHARIAEAQVVDDQVQRRYFRRIDIVLM